MASVTKITQSKPGGGGGGFVSSDFGSNPGGGSGGGVGLTTGSNPGGGGGAVSSKSISATISSSA